MLLASFDIGKKNFAFTIEEVKDNELLAIQNIPIDERYNTDGTPTDPFKAILESVYKTGNTLVLVNTDLTTSASSQYLDPIIFNNMCDVLDKYEEYWSKCDAIVIEEQMSFGQKHNTMALKLGQHCHSYFICKYGRDCNVIVFPSYHKTQVLGQAKESTVLKSGKVKYKAVDKPKRKKWAVQQAVDILTCRNDLNGIELHSSYKKKDDVSDVICQLQAFKVMAYIDNHNFVPQSTTKPKTKVKQPKIKSEPKTKKLK